MQKWTDEHIEIIIGNLLKSGVILSSSVVLFGGILYLVRHGHGLPQYHVFAGVPESLRSVQGVLRQVSHFSARAIIQLGILLLIATPVARVAFAAVAFAVERDKLYVVLTLVVLTILLCSLIWGQG